MWEVMLAICLPTIAPGLALLRILDASADTFRKALLCFPIGLLALYGISGFLFVANLWSVTNLTMVLILANAISVAFLFRKVHVEKSKYTQWQKMEAAVHGIILSETEPVYAFLSYPHRNGRWCTQNAGSNHAVASED